MEMNGETQHPQVGDHVWHVDRFKLNAGEMRRKGLEGFRDWGYEVVESVLEKEYLENRTDGTAAPVWTADTVKREVGAVTPKNRYILWRVQDFGTVVFQTAKEAARSAEARSKQAELGLHESAFERRPMYKNWKHWMPEQEIAAINRTAADAVAEEPVVQKKSAAQRVRKRKAELSEDLYIRWRDGKITAKDGAEALGIALVTFIKYGKEQLKERGEVRTRMKPYAPNRLPLPENFCDVYEQWEAGELTTAESARKCGMNWTTFRNRAMELKRRREAEGILG